MRLRVAKKVLWPAGIRAGPHRLGTIDRARLKMRRYVGPLPPAWDAVDRQANRARRWTYLVRHRIEDFCDTHDAVMKSIGWPFGRPDGGGATREGT